MSVRLRSVEDAFECAMCEASMIASWRELAARGWVSHAAGAYEPIRLCGSCALVIANRRAASA